MDGTSEVNPGILDFRTIFPPAVKLPRKSNDGQEAGAVPVADLENTHHNTKDGIHTANMGGC